MDVLRLNWYLSEHSAIFQWRWIFVFFHIFFICHLLFSIVEWRIFLAAEWVLLPQKNAWVPAHTHTNPTWPAVVHCSTQSKSVSFHKDLFFMSLFSQKLCGSKVSFRGSSAEAKSTYHASAEAETVVAEAASLVGFHLNYRMPHALQRIVRWGKITSASINPTNWAFGFVVFGVVQKR